MGRFNLLDFGSLPPYSGVIEYLTKHGWTIVDHGSFLRCEGPLVDNEGQRLFRFLPAGEQYSDYALRLEDLIVFLRNFEQRPVIEILHEMAELGSPTAVHDRG